MRTPEPQLAHNAVDPIAEDIRKLEIGIRRLKIEYDRFFAGARKREPVMFVHELKKIIKRYVETPIGPYGQRFHYNSLVARFNVMSELWNKQLRRHEEGDRRSAPPPKAARERVLAKCRVKDPASERGALREIYSRYLEALAGDGHRKSTPSFQKFVQGISSQAQRLRKSSGCAEIELRLLFNDGKVQLRARACR